MLTINHRTEALTGILTTTTSVSTDGRHFVVDFVCRAPRMSIQRTFVNTLSGRESMELFKNSIKNERDLLIVIGGSNVIERN
jgi:hypothetical protein